jgi:hypothetical protein
MCGKFHTYGKTSQLPDSGSLPDMGSLPMYGKSSELPMHEESCNIWESFPYMARLPKGGQSSHTFEDCRYMEKCNIWQAPGFACSRVEIWDIGVASYSGLV